MGRFFPIKPKKGRTVVKIRESLPLVEGVSEQDSASLIAGINASLGAEDLRITEHTSLPIISQTASQIIDEHTIDIDSWLEAMAKRCQQMSLPLLSQACNLLKTQDLHHPSTRSNAFLTGVGMADILSYLYPEEDALVAAMLYRAVRKNVLDMKQIRQVFGKDIAQLVQDTLAMGRLSDNLENNKRLEDHFNNNQREQLANIYSLLISVTNDVRVVLIKLAERTFAMRELSFANFERQQRVAREVMTIYAPLAHRLGIAQIKWELEDLAFRYLAPDDYKRIAKLLAEKRSEREAYIERVQDQLKNALVQAQIEGEVKGRVKHIYSIYRKMKLKNLSFDQLYDIRALRVLVPNKADCYQVLGLVHGLWRHIPEQFDDYIANPKANGYRSLHTAVIAENKSLEVQIRTFEMHYEAELGMCSHVNYKEGLKNKNNPALNNKINSLRQLLSAYQDTHQDNDKPQKITDTQTDPNRQKHDSKEEDALNFDELETIYIFSRDGDIIDLPKGATVLDFAYQVHTQVGNRAQAARVNQKYVPLTYRLKTGEQVEIITKQSREPNRDWLVPSLGYITTSHARNKLRQWFNRQDRDKNIEIGRQMLHKELERLSIAPSDIKLTDYTQTFNQKTPDDLLVGLVTGEIGLHQLTGQIVRQLKLDEPEKTNQTLLKTLNKDTPQRPKHTNAYNIELDGLDNTDLHLAGCCHPIHGEPIAGYITQSSGISIHRQGCPEYHRLIQKEPERQIQAQWHTQEGRRQPVEIHLEAYDRRGLLKDLTQVIDNENINIRRVDSITTDDNIAHLKIHLEVSSLTQLAKLLAKLEQQPSIRHARRASTQPKP